MIHYQDTFPLEVFPRMAIDNIDRAARERRFKVELVREVKSYSPGVSHMVLDMAGAGLDLLEDLVRAPEASSRSFRALAYSSPFSSSSRLAKGAR